MKERLFTFVDINEKVKDLVTKLNEGYKAFIVLKDGKYFGVIPENILVRISLNPEEKIEHYVVRVHPLKKDFDIWEAINLIVSSGSRVIPIEDEKGEIVDVFTVEKALEYIKDQEYSTKKRVSDIMSEDIVFINWKDKVTKALIIMKRKGVSRLIVLDDGRKPIGILTVGDIVRKIVFEKESQKMGEYPHTSFSVEVRSIMSENLITINANEKIKKAISIMLENDIVSLPISKNNKIIGIITAKDILADYLAYFKLTNYSIVIHGINIDEEDYKWISKRFENRILRKYKDIIGEDPIFVLHVKPVREVVERDGTMRFFSIKARLTSGKVRLYASVDGVDLYSTVNNILHIFENELEKKKHEEEREYLLERLLKEAPF